MDIEEVEGKVYILDRRGHRFGRMSRKFTKDEAGKGTIDEARIQDVFTWSQSKREKTLGAARHQRSTNGM